MRSICVLVIAVLIPASLAVHMQSNAFSNWNNQSSTQGSGQNPAMRNWLNGQPRPTSPNNAFTNWANKPGTAQPNAFNNWMNNGQRPGQTTNGQSAFNNWNNRPNPGGPNAFNKWMNNSTTTSGNLDMRLRNFLNQNRLNYPVPTDQSCMRYSVSNTHNNYHVTCSLPNGQRFTQDCYGRPNCSMVTCKLSMCSRIPRGGLYRVGF